MIINVFSSFSLEELIEPYLDPHKLLQILETLAPLPAPHQLFHRCHIVDAWSHHLGSIIHTIKPWNILSNHMIGKILKCQITVSRNFEYTQADYN